jgi:hypothetical protein
MNSTRYAHKRPLYGKKMEKEKQKPFGKACHLDIPSRIMLKRLAGHFKKHPEDVAQLCCMLCCAKSAPVDCSIEQNCQEEECKALGDNVVASCVNSVNSDRVVASFLTFAES